MTDPAPRVEFTEDERARMDEATRLFRSMEWELNALLGMVPQSVVPQACLLRMQARRLHDFGATGVALGLLPEPREEAVGIEPAPMPDMEGGGK